MSSGSETVRGNMTKDVVFMRPTESLRTAYGLMQNIGCRHIPIVDGDKLVAMLSDRDILLLARTDERGVIEVPEVPVSEAMSKHPLTCRENTKISEVATVFLDRKIDSLAVIDEHRQLVGMITTTDLIELLKDDDDKFGARIIPFRYRRIHHEDWSRAATGR